MREEMLVIENGKISSSGNEIYSELYLHVYRSEIFGVIFDNILDMQCLLDLFKGNNMPDSGRICINDQKILPSECPRYFGNFIAVIEKTGKLIGSLSVTENVLLFADNMQKYFIGKKKYDLFLDGIKKKLRVNISSDKPVSGLTEKERVIIELIKAYAEGKKLVALSDITGFLKSTEIDEVFSLMVRLRESGMAFIIMETLGDIVFKWVDRLAIIRNGKTLGILSSGDIKRQQVFSALIGDQKKQPYKRMVTIRENESSGRVETEEQHPVLKFVDINTEILKDLNFSVSRGEVVKVYYMDDSSCNHIIELLKGIRKQSSGHILISDREYMVNDTHQAVGKGICFVEESPYKSMFVFEMSILDNICLTLSRKVPMIWVKRRFIKSIKEFVSRFMDEDIEKTKLSALSPVKLQQIAYLKWYIYAPAVVVCVKPFTEVDIHLREVTVDMIEVLRRRGISVIILTPNFSETYLIDGETVYVRNGCTISEDDVYQIIYGAK